MEANQIDVLSSAVFRDLEKIEYAKKPGGNGEGRSDIRKADRLDGIDFDLTVIVHAVASACFDVRTQPYPHAAGDFPAADAVSQSFSEDHRESLTFRDHGVDLS